MNPSESMNRAAMSCTAIDPSWVGYWLACYRDRENLSDAKLADRLGCSTRGLALAALCLTPRPEHFAEDVNAIARVSGASAAVLANILRHEQALAAWATNESASARGGAAADFLIAAHEADQPPPKGDDDPDPALG